jgi:hypothetical protein
MSVPVRSRNAAAAVDLLPFAGSVELAPILEEEEARK